MRYLFQYWLTDQSIGSYDRRPVAEELGCRIAVTRWLDGEVTIRPGLCLRAALATLVAGEPVPVEHDVVRWLRADQLHEVTWLTADEPFVAQLPPVLGGGPWREP